MSIRARPNLDFNQTPVIENNPSADEAIGRLRTPAGALDDLFAVATPDFGTDGPASSGSVTHALSFVLSGSAPFTTNLVVTPLTQDICGTDLEDMTVGQRTVQLFQVSPTVIEGRITGDNDDNFVAFRLTIVNAGDPANAQIQVDQFLPIDHGADNPDLFDEQISMLLQGSDRLNLQQTTTVTDGDGDTASSSAQVTLISDTASFVSIDDDGPSVSVSLTNKATVVLDETSSNQDSDVNDNTLPSLFNGLGTPIEVANSAGDVASPTVNFGTDGPAISDAQVLSLTNNGAAFSGTATNLFDDDTGNRIFLYTLATAWWLAASAPARASAPPMRAARSRSRSALSTATSGSPNTARSNTPMTAPRPPLTTTG